MSDTGSSEPLVFVSILTIITLVIDLYVERGLAFTFSLITNGPEIFIVIHQTWLYQLPFATYLCIWCLGKCLFFSSWFAKLLHICLHFYIEWSSIRKKKRLRVYLCWFFPGCKSSSFFLCQVHVLVKYMYILKHTWWQVKYMSCQVLVLMYCNILSELYLCLSNIL